MLEENIEFERYYKTKKIINILFIILLISYTVYHLYNGNYGFKNYIEKHKILSQKELELQKMKKEIFVVKRKIENLQDNNLDADLLDEEIRRNTGYAKKNEIIIYSKDLK